MWNVCILNCIVKKLPHFSFLYSIALQDAGNDILQIGDFCIKIPHASFTKNFGRKIFQTISILLFSAEKPQISPDILYAEFFFYLNLLQRFGR